MYNYDNLLNSNVHSPDRILLITETGEKIGVVETRKAKGLAYSKNLDLICINADAKPPVCKIMDYSKFLYQKKKKEKENKAKQHNAELKEIQLRPQIAEHDLNVKIEKAISELKKKNRIKLVVCFKGRQITHPELGFDILNKFISKTSEYSVVYKEGKLDGKRIEAILNPKK